MGKGGAICHRSQCERAGTHWCRPFCPSRWRGRSLRTLALPPVALLTLRPVAAAVAHLGAALRHVLAVQLAEPGPLLVGEDTTNGLHRRLVVLPELRHHRLQLIGKLTAHHRAPLPALPTCFCTTLSASLAGSLAHLSAPLAHLLHAGAALLGRHLLALAPSLRHVLAHLRLQRRVSRLDVRRDPLDLCDLGIGEAELRAVLEHALGVRMAVVPLPVGMLLGGEADREHENDSCGCKCPYNHLSSSANGETGCGPSADPPSKLHTPLRRHMLGALAPHVRSSDLGGMIHHASLRAVALALLLAVVTVTGGCAASAEAVAAHATPALTGAETVVVVVRHAERADEPGAREDDPDLSASGHARAEALAEALADARIGAIYTTDRRRTVQTAEPVARRFGLSIRDREIDARDGAGYGTALMERLRAEHRGETVLVVGHSNTVPAIVSALSGYDIPDIDDAEFDRVYIVVLGDAGPPRLFRTRFGAATPIPLP
jgi:broad specificity phosphatase PhoE